VTTFEDHTLWHKDTNTNNIFITAAQDYIVSYCRDAESAKSSSLEWTDGIGQGTINISHILTGKCVAKIAEPTEGGALRDVTALYFSEERSELYVGNRQGVLHIFRQ